MDYDRPPGGLGIVSAWISLVMGVLCMMMGQNFVRWASAKVAGRPFVTGWLFDDGRPRGYFDLLGGTAWSETALFTMGVALVLDAVLMFAAYRTARPNRALVAVALAVTLLALVLNIGVFGYLMSLGITPLMSLIAILIGGIMVFDHVPLLRARGR